MLNHIHDEDFLAFEKAAKQKLSQKVKEHPFVAGQAEKLQKYTTLSNTFKKLNDENPSISDGSN